MQQSIIKNDDLSISNHFIHSINIITGGVHVVDNPQALKQQQQSVYYYQIADEIYRAHAELKQKQRADDDDPTRES